VLHDLVKKRGLTFVKALRVKGIREFQQRVIRVMTELMEKGPEKGPEGDNALVFYGPHPERDFCRRAPRCRFIETVELAP
jgi:hypothetical protein